MKITQEVDYALRVVHYFCISEPGARIEAKAIADHEKVPIRFLLKILRKLTQAGIINSFRGVNGGYTLARTPEEITFLDVMEAIDGPMYVWKCIENEESCNAGRCGQCRVHDALDFVQKRFNSEFKKITFDKIISGDFENA